MKPNPLVSILPSRLTLLMAPLITAWPQDSRAANQEWSGANGGTWHTLTNWTSGTGFPGDSVTNTAGEGLATDIMSIVSTAGNTTGTIGVNFTQLGGLSLGAIDINKASTNTTAVVIGANAAASGLMQLNGATVNGVANTILRNHGYANLTFNRFNTSTNAGTLGLVLGTVNGEIFVGQDAAATPALRTLTINSIISEATAGNGFTKTGTGILTLTAPNQTSGLVAVRDGSLRLQHPTAAGTSNILLSNNDGSALNNNDVLITGGLTYTNPLVLENMTNQNARVRLQSTNTVSGGTNSWNGDITFRSLTPTGGNQALLADTAPMVINGNLLQDPALPSPLIFIRGGNAHGPGFINGNIFLGSGVLFKTDDGPWTINSTGNTMGPVTVAAGTLILNNNDALEPDTVLTMGQNSATTGRMVINAGFTQQLTGIIGATASTSPTGHSIFGPGTIDFGATPRTINVADNTATLNDLTIHAPIAGSGGFSKLGAGNLFANGAIGGPVIVSAGGFGGTATIASTLTVQSGTVIGAATASTSGTLSAAGITLASGTNIVANIGTTAAGGSDMIANTGTLTSGGTTITLVPNGSLANGFLPLIGYTGASPGVAPFTLGLPPLGGIGSRATATLMDNGVDAIGINISGADKVYWTGAASNTWDIATTTNWKLQSNDADTTFQQMDALLFDDRGTNTSIVLSTAVNPVRAEFTNSTAVSYTISGSGSFSSSPLASPMVLDKTGSGTVTIATTTSNSYTGATNVTNGLLIANMVPGAATAAVAAIPTASVVNVTGAGTVRFSADNTNATAVALNVAHTITGNGTVEHQPRAVAGQTAAVSSTFTGNNRDFSGTLRLLTPASGTGRLNNVPAASLGTASVEVQSGHQVYTATGQVYPNPIKLAGTGFQDASGNLGALRLETNSIWSGPVTIDPAGARITSHNTNVNNGGTVSGPISGGPLEVNVSNYNNSYVVFFTGTNSYSTTTIGGGNTQTAGVPSMRLNIGNGGTSGTLGDGAVIINGDGANGVLDLDRADGFTLKPGNTITAGGSNLTRTFLDLNCTGTGFANNNVTIDLGTPGVSGGQIRAGIGRANTLATLTGSVEAGTLLVGGHNTALPTINTTCTIASGCNLAVTNISVCGGGTTQPLGNTAGAVLNIDAGSTVSATSQMYVGDGANSGGTININGDVTVGHQVRVGHWSNELSTINVNSGANLLLAGDSPTLTPSTSAAGGAGTAGDNNLNALATAAIVGGGIYLGIDGTGVLNHSGGTITTNWIVLDNRGNSTGGGDGIDRYNISGSALLRLRSEWGIIARNTSTEVRLDGGTIQLDNSGTGGPVGNTGPDLDVPIDAPLVVAALSTPTTLDTNGVDNSFTLQRALSGLGGLRLTGTGWTIIPATNNSSAFGGSVTVDGALLRLDGQLGGTQTVKNASTLAGTGTGGTITVESGGILSPGPGVGTLSGASANLQGGSRYDVEITGAAVNDRIVLSGALTANGTIKVVLVGYAPVLGNTFDITDAASFAGTPVFDFSGAALSAGLAWDTSAFLTNGTIKVVDGDPYDAWATANGISGGKTGDHDGDGVSNLLEFATNSNAASGSEGARAFAKLAPLGGDSVLTLTIATRKNAVFAADGATQKATKDNVIYVVEGTSDLATWDSIVTELNAADSAALQSSLGLPALGADWEWHSFRTDDGVTGDPRDFIRLRVTSTP